MKGRRGVKGRREREIDTQPNAEFQRMARRDKKAFLNEQNLGYMSHEKMLGVGALLAFWEKLNDNFIRTLYHLFLHFWGKFRRNCAKFSVTINIEIYPRNTW